MFYAPHSSQIFYCNLVNSLKKHLNKMVYCTYLINLCSDILNKSKHHHGCVIILSTVRLLSEHCRLVKYIKRLSCFNLSN